MKYYLFIFLIITTITCKKDDPYNGYYSGTGSALLNNYSFNGLTRSERSLSNYCYLDCLDISITYFNEQGYDRIKIAIYSVPIQPGKYILGYQKEPWLNNYKNKFIVYTYGADGDVLLSFYHIYEDNPENWIKIDKIDYDNGDIQGSFQAKVAIHEYDIASGSKPDTLNIVNGSFNGKINFN